VNYNHLPDRRADPSVAAAFHAAQSGAYPTPTTTLPPPRNTRPSKSPVPPNPALLSPPGMSQGHRFNREKSPAEQLADSARALSPVRFFLRETNPDEDYGSFSSLGDASADKSGETSYDYRQEDNFVRQQAAAASANGSHGHSSILNGLNGNGSKGRNGANGSAANGPNKGRRSKGRDEDMPYRPAEDEWQVGSEDSGSDGEGIVRGGGLDGRAGTRGVRKEKGEGYLGMALGLQPRRRTRRGGDAGNDGDGYDGHDAGPDDYNDNTASRSREVTPVPSHLDPSDRRYRSPTPVQLITRAFSPRTETSRAANRVDRPKDRRQPPTWRTVLTNLLHGLALALQYIVEAGVAIAHTLLVRPFRAVFGSTKQFVRAAKANWWKWVLGLLTISLLLRLSDAVGRRSTGYAVPDVPPNSIDELVGRLSQLEKAVGMLSDSSRLLVEAEREGKRVDDDLARRMSELEGSLDVERKRLSAEAASRSKSSPKSAGADKLQGSFDALKKEVDTLSGRVGSTEKQWTSASGRFDAIDKDVNTLRSRVDEVEQRFKAVMDDGRLRAALDRILPEYMPVRRTLDGGIDIDPTFWTEMRKVLVPRTDADQVVRSALAGMHSPSPSTPPGKTDKELEAWADKMFAKKAREQEWASRSEFAELLEGEVGKLKHIIEALPRLSSADGPKAKGKAKSRATSSSVTIKSTKGEDITSLLTDLIDAALLRYSKDTIARPDYALFTAGARVIPSITSDTFVLSMPGWLSRTIMGHKPIEGRSPATALHPDISVGNCWPFAGGEGQLGILLNRRVRVEDVTVEHASADVALDTSTAPREVEVVSAARIFPSPRPCFCFGAVLRRAGLLPDISHEKVQKETASCAKKQHGAGKPDG